MKNIIKKGFTLAEVLITLAILGVVAAVTLPNMISDQKYQQLGIQLAKFSSTLENAATAYAVGIGGEFGSAADVLDFAQNTFILKEGAITHVDSDYKYKNGCTNPDAAYSCTLKDGTRFGITKPNSAPGAYKADTNVVGSGAFIVYFLPDKKIEAGLPANTIKGFFFTVTTKGYVFPYTKTGSLTSTYYCLHDIYDANYIVKPSLYTSTSGRCKK